MRVESARTDVDLIPGPVHIVDEHAGDLGEQLPASLVGGARVDLMQRDHLGARAGGEHHALHRCRRTHAVGARSGADVDPIEPRNRIAR